MKVVEKYACDEFDVYCFEEKRAMTTREITVMVDFEKKKITGDCIAYGEWSDLDFEECKEILLAMPAEEKLRNFKDFL